MHSMLVTEQGLTLMAADTPNSMDYAPGTNDFAISLSGDDEGELRGYWDKLSDGATVTMPLDRAPWGDLFGMCIDKFGVSWLVNIAGQSQQS
jgi:PhnB protein